MHSAIRSTLVAVAMVTMTAAVLPTFAQTPAGTLPQLP